MNYYDEEEYTIQNGHILIPIEEITVIYSMDREWGPVEASVENVEIKADVPKKVRDEISHDLTWTLIGHEINFNDPDWERDVEEVIVEETGIRQDRIKYSMK